jgi:hypothetical protein
MGDRIGQPRRHPKLMEWLDQFAADDWNQCYLRNARDIILAQDTAISALRARVAELEARATPQAGAGDLRGPFGWLNGCRGLSEDSWTLESDPLENSEEYFAIPLYALVDPFKEAGKDATSSPAQGTVEPIVWVKQADLDGPFYAIPSWKIAESGGNLPLYATPPVDTEAVKALRFYADPNNWVPGRWPEDDLPDAVDGLICVGMQHEEGGSILIADCGDRARAALSAFGSQEVGNG